MAEAEQGDKTAPHRRHHQQNRPPHSNRGRGRLDPHVSKALHIFGVSDLRELLDRKHQDQRQSKSGPPPDPSYSYLKDPLRENTNCDNPSRIHYKEHPERGPDSRSRGHATRGSRGRGGYLNRDDKQHQLETSYIRNPVNIKIALTTSTGERSCKLDEEKKLVDIKYVSNQKSQERRPFRGEGSRGRGSSARGRGRYESGQEWDNSDTKKEFRGRGGRRRGHGRERGRYNPNTSNRYNDKNTGGNSVAIPATEIPTEDNWDLECSDSPLEQAENVEKKEEGNSANLDNVCVQDTEEYEPEEYYTEDDVHTEDDIHRNDDLYSEDEVHSETTEKNLFQRKTEEDLVITSVSEKKDDGGKRTVKFKLVGKGDNAAQLQQTVDQSNIKSEQKIKLEDDNIRKNEKKAKANKTVKREHSKRAIREEKTKEKPSENETEDNEKLKPNDAPKIELVNENENT